MTDVGNDFITFLKAYYPEDVSKLSTDKASDSMVNAIIAKHKTKFDIWKKVPERIRDEYLGRVPDDILKAARIDDNLTLAECREIEKSRETSSAADLATNGTTISIAFGAAAIEAIENKTKDIMKKGYKYNSARALATSSATRTEFFKLYNDGKITKDVLKNAVRKTRENDHATIKADWAENQPERLLVRIAKKLDLNKTDSETAIPQMFELMKKVRELGREEELEKLLKDPTSRYDKWSENTKDLFDDIRKSDSPSREFMYNVRIDNLKKEWTNNQPEKMLVHVAKSLQRGHVSKEDATTQMNDLMKKVKELGREADLEKLLKEPVSRYDKWSVENRAIFNEIMHSHDIGVAAKSFNRVKETLGAKEDPKDSTTTETPQSNQTITVTQARQRKGNNR